MAERRKGEKKKEPGGTKSSSSKPGTGKTSSPQLFHH